MKGLNMKIRTRLLLILSTVPILIILLIGIELFQSSNLNKVSNSLQEKYELSFLATQIHQEIKDEAINLRNIVISNDSNTIQKDLLKIQNDSDAIDQNIALLESNLRTRIEIKANDEIGESAAAFNKMAQSLEEQRTREQSLIWSNSPYTLKHHNRNNNYGNKGYNAANNRILFKIL